MAVLQPQIAAQIEAFIKSSKGINSEIAIKEFANNLATVITTAILSAQVTVAVTIPPGTPVQVVPATGTGSTISPAIGTGVGSLS